LINDRLKMRKTKQTNISQFKENYEPLIDLLSLKRERERTVNMILQTFQAVYLVKFELFRSFNVTDRFWS
jgi:hypothetical protein